jgi:hypothetical protein
MTDLIDLMITGLVFFLSNFGFSQEEFFFEQIYKGDLNEN